MKIFLIVFLVCFSCSKDIKDPDLEDFCRAKPDGWDCEIIRANFNPVDIPRNTTTPLAIIKFKNNTRTFPGVSNTVIHPSLTLDFYSIKQKDELIRFIKSQLIFSWCIPAYYGETKDYFILTSPCFMNSGWHSEQSDSVIDDLQKALKELIEINDYDLP